MLNLSSSPFDPEQTSVAARLRTGDDGVLLLSIMVPPSLPCNKLTKRRKIVDMRGLDAGCKRVKRPVGV